MLEYNLSDDVEQRRTLFDSQERNCENVEQGYTDKGMRKAAAVSMAPGLNEIAQKRAKSLGMTFSQYVTQLIRMDLAAGESSLTVLAESAPKYDAKGKPKK